MTTNQRPPNGADSTRPMGRILALTAGVPLLLGAIAIALLLSWRGSLPDQIATHWGQAGRPDRFGSVTATIITSAVVLAVLLVLGIVVALALTDPTQVRFAAAMITFLAVVMAGLPVVTVAGQRGLADASSAALNGWAVAAVLVVATLLALGVGALIPSWQVHRRGEPAGVAGRTIELSATERVSWSHSVGSSWPMALVLVASAVMTVVIAFMTQLWGLLAVTALLVLLAVVMWALRVTVDDTGVTMRSLVRWPHSHIPLEQITDARVVQVNALRDFGGYGYRVAVRGPLATAKGWVLRSGPALLMDRRDGSSDLVVVNDADVAAGLVNALRQRTAH